MSARHPGALSIPLYSLYYYDDPSEFEEITPEWMKMFMDKYSVEEQAEIFDALKWANENPDYDFHLVLDNLRYSNSEIYDYVKRTYSSALSIREENP